MTGVPIQDPDYYNNLPITIPPHTPVPKGGYGTPSSLDIHFLRIESQAGQASPKRLDPNLYTFPFADNFSSPFGVPTGESDSDAVRIAGTDDISNHNVSAPGGAIQ